MQAYEVDSLDHSFIKEKEADSKIHTALICHSTLLQLAFSIVPPREGLNSRLKKFKFMQMAQD